MSSNSYSFRAKRFGQIVIGPPGSGKTTYCCKMNAHLNSIGRNCTIVNLDPGSDYSEINAKVDVRQLISLMDSMKYKKLGPNAALIHCFQYLTKNISWLISQIMSSPSYYLFDCPGQVELTVHQEFLILLLKKLEKIGYHLCTVNLIDAHYFSEPTKFVSTLFTTLNSMLVIGLPQVNILNKVDLVMQFDTRLKYHKNYYTEVDHLTFLIDVTASEFDQNEKFSKLNTCLLNLIADSGIVNFYPLHFKQNFKFIQNIIDTANGFTL